MALPDGKESLLFPFRGLSGNQLVPQFLGVNL
jgi:hypothetical protein